MTSDPDTFAYRPFPADGYQTGWISDDRHPTEPESTEELTIRWDNEAWTVAGTVSRDQVEYVVRCSPTWEVRQFMLFRDLPEPDLWLGTDGAGRWGEVNGGHRPELDGARDISLAITPFTLSLPIRRLGLAVRSATDIDVVAIDVDTLATQLTAIRLERLGTHDWSISSGPATLEVAVDDFGLVTDIPGAFRRLAAE